MAELCECVLTVIFVYSHLKQKLGVAAAACTEEETGPESVEEDGVEHTRKTVAGDNVQPATCTTARGLVLANTRPRHGAWAVDGIVPKRARRVMRLTEKLNVCDELRAGMSVSDVGRLFGVNESTIRSIRYAEQSIREAVRANVSLTSKISHYRRDESVIKMEKALFLWIQKSHKHGVLLNTNLILKKARAIYEAMCKADRSKGSALASSNTRKFQASKGWLEKFKKRFSLHSIHPPGESGAADQQAVQNFPAVMREMIEGEGYLPEQVFNMSQTNLFWKKLAQAPDFKAAKDWLALLFCGNAEGHMIKPGLIYKTGLPHALKGKDEQELPVFWMTSRKAWSTEPLVKEWYYYNFLPEVRNYLTEKKLPFKALLIMDRSQAYPEAHELAADGVKILLLPPNTAPLLQPMEQGVHRMFKEHYTSKCLQRTVAALEDDNKTVQQLMEDYSIADCLSVIQEALAEVEPHVVNGCWRKLWPQCVYDFQGFTDTVHQNSCPPPDTVSHILSLAHRIGGDGFSDMDRNDVEELLKGHAIEMTDEALLELIHSAEEEEEEEDTNKGTHKPEITLETVAKGLRLAKSLTDFFCNVDPSMTRSTKFKTDIESATACYRQLCTELKQAASHPTRSEYFRRHSNTTHCTTPSTAVLSVEEEVSVPSLPPPPSLQKLLHPPDTPPATDADCPSSLGKYALQLVHYTTATH